VAASVGPEARQSKLQAFISAERVIRKFIDPDNAPELSHDDAEALARKQVERAQLVLARMIEGVAGVTPANQLDPELMFGGEGKDMLEPFASQLSITEFQKAVLRVRTTTQHRTARCRSRLTCCFLHPSFTRNYSDMAS
jgi:hypothetical protein